MIPREAPRISGAKCSICGQACRDGSHDQSFAYCCAGRREWRAQQGGGQAERQLPMVGEEVARASHDGGEIRH